MKQVIQGKLLQEIWVKSLLDLWLLLPVFLVLGFLKATEFGLASTRVFAVNSLEYKNIEIFRNINIPLGVDILKEFLLVLENKAKNQWRKSEKWIIFG